MTEPTRAQGVEECERRALEYGLPPLSWPPGWPKGSYSLDPLRAALFAQEHGALREYSAAAFARNFVTGTGLLGDAPIEVAEEVGLDPDATRAAIAGPMRERLKHATEDRSPRASTACRRSPSRGSTSGATTSSMRPRRPFALRGDRGLFR
jgi:2-hydroxychromene-2-carboxylate isomerase